MSNRIIPLLYEGAGGQEGVEAEGLAERGGAAGERGDVEGGAGPEVNEVDRQLNLEESPEEPVVRAVRDPGQPTREEREHHELTHLPFRPWCEHCVAGRAPNDPHPRRAPQEHEGPPRVSVDYGFVGERAGDDEEVDAKRTILVMKVEGCGAVMARCVKGKGRADPFAVKWLLDQLRRLGLGRVVLQADGEPAQRSYVKDVIEEAARTSSLGIAAAHTPPHDHQSNGGVEKAVRDVKDLVRSLRSSLMSRVGPVALESPVFEWLTLWAAELLTAARVGHDGMTAFRRLRGRSWEPSLAVFGEQVLARRPRALEQGDMEPRWDQVTYLGSRWGTAEHWVADEAGTARLVRAIRRKPMQERWSAERLARITGLPDEPLRSEGGPAVAPAPPLEVVPYPDQDVPAPRVTRGFHIREADLREHGFTRLCPKCDAIRTGRQVGTAHTPECRGRFRAIFEALGDSRVERAMSRQGAGGAMAAPALEEAPAGAADDAVEPDAPAQLPQSEAPLAPAGMEIEDEWMDLARRMTGSRRRAPAAPGAPAAPEDAGEGGRSRSMSGVEEPAEDAMIMTAHALPSEEPARPSAPNARLREPHWADLEDTDDEDVEQESTEDGWVDEAEDLADVISKGARKQLSDKERVRRLCMTMDDEQVKKTVTELFSPPRVNREVGSRASDLTAGTSFDLVVDAATGESWDFLRSDHRRRCWKRLREEDPWIVIGSPPCTAFSRIQGLNKGRVDPHELERRQVEAQVLLSFALSVYAWQLGRGRYFLHEHPATASSWKLPEVAALHCRDGVATAVSDACVFGMCAEDCDGLVRPVLKPTRGG